MLQCVLGTSFISTTLAFIYLKKKKKEEKVLLGFTFLLWLEVVITLLL